MRIRILVLAASAAMLGLAPACNKKPGKKKPAAKKAPMGPMVGADGKLAIPAKGKKLDPPVKKSVIPKGAWYCDMGTVHYARMEMGDRTCPLCMMRLKKMGATAAPAPPAHMHGGGHMHVHKPGDMHMH